MGAQGERLLLALRGWLSSCPASSHILSRENRCQPHLSVQSGLPGGPLALRALHGPIAIPLSPRLGPLPRQGPSAHPPWPAIRHAEKLYLTRQQGLSREKVEEVKYTACLGEGQDGRPRRESREQGHGARTVRPGLTGL